MKIRNFLVASGFHQKNVMKKFLLTVFSAFLLLFFAQKASAYTFTITGNLQVFDQPGASYYVAAYSQDYLYYQAAITDSLGNYSMSIDFPGGINPPLLVSTYNVCTDDIYFYENIIPFSGSTSLNFLLCNPATTCQASYSYEHSPTDPLTLNFIDYSLAASPDYLWDFGDGAISTAQNPTHTYLEPGYKFISLTVSNDSCSNTLAYWVLVGDLLACNCPNYFAAYCTYLPDSTQVGFNNLCEAQCYGYEDVTPCFDPTSCDTYFYFHFNDSTSLNTVSFISFSFGEVVSYAWDFGDGATSVEANPVHTFGNNEGYLVTLTIVTASGCTKTYYSLVLVGSACDCPNYHAPVCLTTSAGLEVTLENSCYADCLGFTDYENCNGATYCFADFGVTLIDSAAFTYQFTDNSYGDSLSYHWYFGDGSSSVEENPVHTYGNEGFYFVGLEVTGSDGCVAYHTYHLIVGDGQTNCQASYYFTHDWQDPLGIIFYDQSFSFTGSNVASWSWNFQDGTTSTEQNPIHSFPTAGVYFVSLTVTFEDGCQSVITFDILAGSGLSPCVCPGDYTPVCVVEPDGSFFTFSNACYAECNGYFDYENCEDINYCQASFYYYQDGLDSLGIFFQDISFGEFTNWLWDFGDGTTSTEQNPHHSYADFGEYTVTLSITSDSGCTSTITYPVNVYDYTGLPACYSYFWFEQNPNDLMSLNFLDFSSPGVDTWFWNFGDGETSTEQNPTHIFPAPGIYLTTLTVSDIQDSCTNTYSMLLWADTVAYYTSTCQALFLPQVSGLEVSFQDLSFPFGAANYAWDFGDGNTSTEQFPVHIYAQPGTFTVSLTIDAFDGCTSTFTVTMNLLTGQFWGNSAPSAIVFNPSDAKEEKPAQDALNLYPNPAGEVVNLIWDKKSQLGTGEAQLSLQSMAGQQVWKADYHLTQGQQQLQIPLTNLPSGMYMLKIIDGSQQHTMKLVKE